MELNWACLLAGPQVCSIVQMHLNAMAFPFSVGPGTRQQITGWASKLPLPQEFPQRLYRWAWDVRSSLEHEGEAEKEETKERISCWRHELWWNCSHGHQQKATAHLLCKVVQRKASWNWKLHLVQEITIAIFCSLASNLWLGARFFSWNFYWRFNHLCSWLFQFLFSSPYWTACSLKHKTSRMVWLDLSFLQELYHLCPVSPSLASFLSSNSDLNYTPEGWFFLHHVSLRPV